MSIVFGRKIPIIQTQIQNNKTGCFEPATVFELDCHDEQDLLETLKPSTKWIYAKQINQNMLKKYTQIKQGNGKNTDTFYILQNKYGETLGMAQTQKMKKNAFNLALIDTKKDKDYKFVGQTLLASISKDIINKSGIRLSIFEPIQSAVPFYDSVCGFQNFGDMFLSADIRQMNTFIKKTEHQTSAPLINLKG